MAPGTIASICVHGAVVVALLVEHSANADVANSWEEVVEGLTYIAPPNVVSSANQLQIRYEASGGGDGDLTAERTDDGRNPAKGSGPGESALASVTGEETPDDALANPTDDAYENAFSVVEVEHAAERDPNSAAPTYPPHLMQQGVEGYAAMRFVVDSTGRVDLMSVRILVTTRPEFAIAVKDAMPAMRFAPARIGDRPVRQLAEQLFRFQILPTQTSAAPTTTPPAGNRPL
ncbi:MAG: energy transducer TonB [Gemmatimonadaceae bacterium]